VAAAILKEETPVTVKDLARDLGVSERTVRYDLKVVGEWFDEQGLELMRRPRVGVWVKGESPAREAAHSLLRSTPGPYPVVAVRQDREWFIVGWLLSSSSPVPVSLLARVLGVSERTVYADLARLRERFADRGLALPNRNGGVTLVGDEMQCRGLMMEFLEQTLGSEGLRALVSSLSADVQSRCARDRFSGGCLRHLLEELGDPDAVRRINEILSKAEHSFGFTFGSTMTAALVAHLLVVLSRVRQGRHAVPRQAQLERLRRRPEWTTASWIVRSLEEVFRVHLGEAEVAYIVLYLADSATGGRAPASAEPWLLLSQEELALCARVIVEEAGECLGISLMEDVELRAGLISHLYASVEKLRAGLPVRNPLLREVLARYPLLHLAVRKAVSKAGILVGVRIPDAEVGWLTLHIGAACERLAQKNRTWKGLVVCASGVGTAQMLKARLETEFPNAEFRLVGAMGESELASGEGRWEPEIVISTVQLTGSRYPTVAVSPFLPGPDVQRVARLVYSNRGPLDESTLLDACRAVFVEGSAGRNPVGGPSLGELVTEDLVAVNVTVESADQAISAAGELLVEGGVVTRGYVEAMRELFQRLGAYIVVAPGVALPHAAPADGALRVGVSVLTLSSPVAFGSPENDPVFVVIALASPGYQEHVRALIDLLDLLHGNLAGKLRRAKTKADVISLMSASF